MPISIDHLYPVAEGQGGYFTTSQAHEVGVSDQQLHYLAKAGSLQRATHGIYRLQRFPAQAFEDVIVATLWAGEGAAASHETALAIYGITDAMPALLHVTVPRRFRGKRQGTVLHMAPLEEHERTRRDGVPVTTLSRTLRDVAVRHGTQEAAEAARQAIERGLISRRRLSRELAAHPETRSILDVLDSSS